MGKQAAIGTTKSHVMVNVDIRLGPVSPAQKQAWKRFWQKLATEAKHESVNDN